MKKKNFFQSLEKKLKDYRKQIEARLKSFGRENPRLKGDFETRFPEYGPEVDDEARETESYLGTLPIEHRLEVRLQRVKEALIRLRKGQYGRCPKCRKKIDPKRLKVVPEAKYCAHCEAELEKK